MHNTVDYALRLSAICSGLEHVCKDSACSAMRAHHCPSEILLQPCRIHSISHVQPLSHWGILDRIGWALCTLQIFVSGFLACAVWYMMLCGIRGSKACVHAWAFSAAGYLSLCVLIAASQACPTEIPLQYCRIHSVSCMQPLPGRDIRDRIRCAVCRDGSVECRIPPFKRWPWR
jgi:hypothetical protein